MPRASTTTTKSKRSPSKAPRRGVGHTHTVVYDVSKQLRTPKEMAAYLEAWLVEAPDDAAVISHALGDIARAVGMSKVAKQSGLSRESLYKALSEDGNPSLDTILRVARAVGVRFHASARPNHRYRLRATKRYSASRSPRGSARNTPNIGHGNSP